MVLEFHFHCVQSVVTLARCQMKHLDRYRSLWESEHTYTCVYVYITHTETHVCVYITVHITV